MSEPHEIVGIRARTKAMACRMTLNLTDNGEGVVEVS
jgi:hypothetical protein